MNTFVRFFFEFISIFFDGIKTMLKGIVEGLKEVTNIKNYSEIINAYKEGFGGPEWLFAVLGLIILIIIFGLIFLIIFFFLKNKLRLGKKGLSQEELGEVLFVHRTTINKWEKGNVIPLNDTLLRISDFFDVSVDELLNGKRNIVEENISLDQCS